MLKFLLILFCVNRINASVDECKQSFVDVVFLVDSSSSISENSSPSSTNDNWNIMKNFIKEIVQLLPLQTMEARVAIVPFSTTIYGNITTLSSDSKAIIDFIDQLPHYGGNTNTSGALRQAHKIFMTSNIAYSGPFKQVIVLVTDGFSNVDSSLTLQEARINKQNGIIQFAIGVTNYINEDELKDLVSDPVSYHYLNASDFKHLNLLVNELLQKLTCSRPPLPEPCKDTRADIVFILDSSGSILFSNENKVQNLSNWITMKSFFMKVANSLNVGSKDTRIALIRYSHIAYVSFFLNTFDNRDDVVNAISNLEIIGSQTNTSGALKVMNNIVFTQEHGDRPHIRNVAILMTDGQSNLDVTDTIPEATRAKKLGVRMFVIGLTDQINAIELTNMSSRPLNQYYFDRTTYSLVDTVVSNLVWNVCLGTCNDYDTDCGSSSKCIDESQLKWIKYPGKLIIGHDYARLNDIQTDDACKIICLQDPQCRSIEYLSVYRVCSVSYYRKDDARSGFRDDPEVDYYEWICS